MQLGAHLCLFTSSTFFFFIQNVKLFYIHFTNYASHTGLYSPCLSWNLLEWICTWRCDELSYEQFQAIKSRFLVHSCSMIVFTWKVHIGKQTCRWKEIRGWKWEWESVCCLCYCWHFSLAKTHSLKLLLYCSFYHEINLLIAFSHFFFLRLSFFLFVMLATWILYCSMALIIAIGKLFADFRFKHMVFNSGPTSTYIKMTYDSI